MPIPPPRHGLTELRDQILAARGKQLDARAAWAHSPNTDTIAATKLADREVDVLLDRLRAAIQVTR